MSALAAVGVAAAIGVACGKAVRPADTTLPSAGSDRDDGTGVLARASADTTVISLFSGPAAQDSRAFGGRVYGGTPYGGTRYGNYQFQRVGTLESSRRPSYGNGYVRTNAAARGSIQGRITWPRAPRVSATLTASGGCSPTVENRTMEVDGQGRVGQAIVYLAGVAAGRGGVVELGGAESSLQLGGAVRVRGCQFVPRVHVLSPPGAILEVATESVDAGVTTVRVAGFDGGFDGAFGGGRAIELAVTRGGVQRVKLNQPGVVEIRDTRLPGRAWVMVAAHPYYTVSADDGSFRLDSVVPGEYILVVWHPPVASEGADGSVRWSGPSQVRTRVRVIANKSQRVTIALPRAQEDEP